MVFKFTIDNWVNRFVPANRVERLPLVIRRFLGKHPTSPASDYFIWLEVFIATFAGIALIAGIFKNHTVFTNHHAPMIIASYGATAILCFNTIQAPLAQPRNILFGHFISSLIGLCIQKLFSLSTVGQSHYWLSGALSVALSSVAMSIFNCIHPPAGASALLPSIDLQIRMMSWWYLPLQIISSLLIITVALITGNIQRSYPTFWWTSEQLKKIDTLEERLDTLEKIDTLEERLDTLEEKIDVTLNVDRENQPFKKSTSSNSINITADDISLPDGINLSQLEMKWLNILRGKLNT